MTVFTNNIKRKLWFGFCPYHSFLVVMFVCLLCSGCCEKLENQGEKAPVIAVSVKSSDVSINTLDLWAFCCNADGTVSLKESAGYIHADGESDVTLSLDSESRYYLLLAGANMPNGIFGSESTFNALTASRFTGFQNDNLYTHWAVVDITTASNGTVELPLELFPTHGKLSVNVTKASDALTLVIDEVNVCSVNAPTQGSFFSALSANEINSGGSSAGNWYFNGPNLAMGPLSRNLAQNIDITASKRATQVCEAKLYENPNGWSDLTRYRESGWELNPAVADADCTGCYLSISYRFVKAPETSLYSENAVQVQKYVPLPPICRGNSYNIDIKINLNEIIVYSSTEVSEEVVGRW